MNLIFIKNIIISWGKTLGAQVWHLVNIKIQNWTCSSSFRTAWSDLKSYCAPIISKLKQVERFQKVLNHFKKFLNRLGTKMKGRVQISGGRVQFWEIRNICPKNGQKWPKIGHLRSCSGLFRGGVSQMYRMYRFSEICTVPPEICTEVFKTVPGWFNNFWKCTMTFQKWIDIFQKVSKVYQRKLEMILWIKYKKYMIQIKIFLISWNQLLIKAESFWSARVTYPSPSKIEWIFDKKMSPAWIAFT